MFLHCLYVKGSVSRDFRPIFFFHESNPAGPLINRLKCFQLFFRFSRDIRSQSCLRGVQHTTKSPIFFCKSTFYTSNLSFHGTCRCVHHPKRFLLIVPLKATRDKQRFQFWLTTPENIWEKLTPRCDAHRGDWLSGVMHTMEIDLAMWCTLRRLTPRWDAHRRVSCKFKYLGEFKKMQKYFCLFVRGPDGIKSWKQ